MQLESMKHNLTCWLFVFLLMLFPTAGQASQDDIEFQRVRTSDGLSNSQVNDIYRDSRGYIWLATQSGLDRYDGFRFKVFYFENLNEKSLSNNCVDGVQESADGRLWVHSSLGYSIYDPLTETFDNKPQEYLSRFGIQGAPDRVLIDDNRNMWITVNGQGLYFIDMKSGLSKLLDYGRQIPSGMVTSLTRKGNRVVGCLNTGVVFGIDARTLRVEWQSDYLRQHRKIDSEAYTVFIDRLDNRWFSTSGQTYVYSKAENKWYGSAREFLTAKGYHIPFNDMILVKDVVEDKQGGLWIATDHLGLLRVNHDDKSFKQYTFDKDRPKSLPDNTIQSLFVDAAGALWIGSYKNGIAYYESSTSKFNTVNVGDVCTILEDASGQLWCGTNDNGIVVYDPKTQSRRHYGRQETGLGSDVVVSSLACRDGSLWFGTYNGGMARYQNGNWKAYRANDGSGLMNDNVWCLCELPDGRVAVGTLGSGLQILDVRTGMFDNFTVERNGLASNYINSMVVGHDGKLLIGHSVNFSTLDLRSGHIENFTGNKSGVPFLSSQFNQIFEDSRGIIWAATSSGMNAFDPKSDQLEEVNWQVGSTGMVACSVIEDRNHNMWFASDHGVARVIVKPNAGQWEFFTTSFNSLDGLQERQFNYRSILLARNGDIIVGGQDGINIISPQQIKHHNSKAHVLFSGLVLFDHPLAVGEKYEGHVILDKSMDESHELRLRYRDNAFTVLLASSEVTVPQKSRFMYRLKGFSDKWLFTSEDQKSVTFTSLSPGNYTLEARVVTRYGTISDMTSRLNITIAPPFYLSFWAILFYILLVAATIWYAHRTITRRQKAKFEMQQIQLETKRAHEIDDMKLTFFTNVSHELRTPLTLIISPLSSLLQKETDNEKRHKLEMIYRNAQRLLNMVTQILDFRKIDKNKETLNLSSGDIVGYVRNIVNTFQSLDNKNVVLSFYSPMDNFIMAFDADKIRKMIDNLLSNALKFTPDGGSVEVTVQMNPKNDAAEKATDMIDIKVADNGIGISDEDKAHIFERFYQVRRAQDNPYGGTGVGLNLVHDFAILHGGEVSVADNPGGGSVFTITLPVRHDASLQPLREEDLPTTVYAETISSDTPVVSDDSETKTFTDSKKYEVLIVDDSADFLEFMKEELESRYKVRTASNGREGLDRISDHKPDIILSDVMMPVMDGNDFCRHVKANKEMATIPFIMLTARLAQEHQLEGLENGADDYITKPFSLDLLYLRIDKLIRLHRSSPDSKAGKIQPELKPVEITSLDEKLVQKATDYVDKNLSDSTISVETMARELGMSRVQLYKRLLPITGSTPSEFIRQIRLRRAEQLLRESQFSVSEVAYRVGFNNPRYFSKYFKDMYGVMPSQYKNGSGE